MFFNPLFISNSSTGSNIDSAKENKFTNTNYLFADIINVSTEKLALNNGNKIELESKNKILFKNFEKLTTDDKNKETSIKNDYLGDDTAVIEFLTSVLTQTETNNSNSEQFTKVDAASFNQETLKAIFETINNGEKISIPINNNGKEIFVEIKKFNEALQNSDTPKIVKLTQSESSNSTNIDYNQVISNILSSLKEKFSSNEFNMSEEKISKLASKIEAKFSKLVSLNDETFKPQKNILATLITDAQKELNLSSKESDELKKTIVTEFVKVINSGAKAESTQSISNKLALTKNEIKLLDGLELEKLTLPELNNKLKEIFSSSSQSSEVKALLSKVESYLKLNSEAVSSEVDTSKFTLPKISEALNLTPKEIEIVKNINTDKVTLLELSDKLKKVFNDPSQSTEVKTLLSKVENYLKPSSEAVSSEVGSSKFALPKTGDTLSLTPQNNIAPQTKVDEKLSLSDLSQKLKLTSGEIDAVQKESFKKVNVPELKEIVKEKISQSPNNNELKTLFAKLEKLEVKTTPSENVKLNEKVAVVNHKKADGEPNFVKKVKNGIKNVFGNKDVVNSINDIEKEKYLVTLKTEKSSESLILKDDAFVKKLKPELLNKTVFASKEGVDLTKLKVLPISENSLKENKIALDKDIKLTKASNEKNGFIETKITKSDSGGNSSNLWNKESSQNEQTPITKIAGDTEQTTDNTKLKPFEKMIIKSAEAESNKATIKESKIESNVLQKEISSKLNIEESHLSKLSVAHNQIFKSDLRVNQNIYKKVDIKNLNQELSQLMQKGEKKIVQFQLTPENLGKLNIKLEVINKVISASIKVDNEATQQLVQNSLEGLKTTLNQNGVQYNSLNVSLSNSEDKNQRFFKQKRKHNNAAKMNVEGFDETFAHKNLGYNKYDFIA